MNLSPLEGNSNLFDLLPNEIFEKILYDISKNQEKRVITQMSTLLRK